MAAVAHEEVADGDPAGDELVDLLQQDRRVDGDAVADQAGLIGVKDARRHDVQLELAEIIDDRVPGVVAGGVSRDDRRALCDQVDDPALAFVSPLAADDYDCWHNEGRPSDGRGSFRRVAPAGTARTRESIANAHTPPQPRPGDSPRTRWRTSSLDIRTRPHAPHPVQPRAGTSCESGCIRSEAAQ